MGLVLDRAVDTQWHPSLDVSIDLPCTCSTLALDLRKLPLVPLTKQRPSGFAQWSFMSWPYLSLISGHHGFTVTFPHSSLLPGRESSSLSVASTSLTPASKEESRQELNLGNRIALSCLYGRRRASVSVNHGQTGSKNQVSSLAEG